jgi:iron complex outermembrane recepter protein
MKHGLRCASVARMVMMAGIAAILGSESPVSAQSSGGTGDLIELSLEQLMAIRVTSAAKREQTISEIPAAIYIITSEDIRRTHATTVMDVLRQVPGAQVARESAGRWSITIRGFNSDHANKLLVLMDGRTLYSPLYTGVDWDMQDIMLQDIERIEVIRGPGASLWGANAVNGVINIITKQTAQTRAGVASFSTGRLEKGSGAVRYGGRVNDAIQYRVFAKYFSRPNMPLFSGEVPAGYWNSFRQGGRVDWSATTRDTLTFSGEWHRAKMVEIDDEITSYSPPFESTVEEHDASASGFLLTQWNRKFSDRSELNLHFFYDRSRQYDGRGLDKDELVATTDLEFQHVLKIGDRQDLVWGGGFRRVRDYVQPAKDSWFTPTRRTARTFNGFMQDEISFFDRKLRLTAGSKIEWNSFSRVEVQPTIRTLWSPTDKHGFWTAVSRGVRVPARNEIGQVSLESIDVNEDDEVVYDLLTGEGFKPEELTSFESGYRFVPTKRFSVDVSAYYNQYHRLETHERGEEYETSTPIPGRITPLYRENNGFGEVYGAEIVGFWTVNQSLRLSGSYSRIHLNLHRQPWSNDEEAEAFEGKSATNTFYIRSYADLPYRLELNNEFRFVGSIPGEDVPAYLDADIHVFRSVGESLTLGVTFDNLFHSRRVEWAGPDGSAQRRGVRASLDWRF